MKKAILFIAIFFVWGQILIAQSELRTVQASLIKTYEEYQEDQELHYCCQGFSGVDLTVSSTLKSQADNAYDVANLGDNKGETAWIEGAKGNGVGEFIQFEYAYDIAYAEAAEGAFNYKDDWKILNGYQKSLQTWRENGRIKRLKMYINGVAFCYVNLLDQPGIQAVALGFLGYLDKDKDKIRIKLEIIEVYAGDKYSDTALSEILW